jgi:hypothetical protein
VIAFIISLFLLFLVLELQRNSQVVTVVNDLSHETAIYLNGKLQTRMYCNDAFEISRITKSKPCRVETRTVEDFIWEWPESLSEVPNVR